MTDQVSNTIEPVHTVQKQVQPAALAGPEERARQAWIDAGGNPLEFAAVWQELQGLIRSTKVRSDGQPGPSKRGRKATEKEVSHG